MDLQRQRRFVEAEYCYQSVLKDDPRNADALNLLGTLALEARKPADAARLVERALEIRPGEAQYLNNLGAAYIGMRDGMRAEKALAKAVRLQPHFVDALCNLGRAYRMLNRSETARRPYEDAHRRAPESTKAITGLADVLVDLGEADEATILYRKALTRDPNLAQAYVGLAMAHRFEPGDPEPAKMLELLASPGTDAQAVTALRHSAGKAQADLGNHDAAFHLFAAAKGDATRAFDLSAHLTRREELVGLLTPQFFEERRGFGIDSEEPVFIVGMPRSGTTLTEQIASSHSKVGGGGELAAIGDLMRVLAGGRSHAEALTSLTRGQSRDLARNYLELLRRVGGSGERITDKMPHNFEHLGLIALLFPNAHIIHCTRDPIDNCVSCFTHHFNENHGYNTDLAVLGQYYREYRRLMAHWREVLPIRMLDFSYEALIADQEGRSRELIDFLGLEWEDACLDFHRNERLVKTPSRWQVRQRIYASSVKAWKKYEKHLGPLFESLGDLAIR